MAALNATIGTTSASLMIRSVKEAETDSQSLHQLIEEHAVFFASLDILNQIKLFIFSFNTLHFYCCGLSVSKCWHHTFLQNMDMLHISSGCNFALLQA